MEFWPEILEGNPPPTGSFLGARGIEDRLLGHRRKLRLLRFGDHAELDHLIHERPEPLGAHTGETLLERRPRAGHVRAHQIAPGKIGAAEVRAGHVGGSQSSPCQPDSQVHSCFPPAVVHVPCPLHGDSPAHGDAALERLEEAFARREHERGIAEHGEEAGYAKIRERAVQVAAEIGALQGDKGLAIETVYGGTDIERQAKRLDKGGDVIVGTPGRVIDMSKRGHIGLASISRFCLDEADRMLDM